MKVRLIQFRVTSAQHERLFNNAQAKGFKTVSEFLRFIGLEKDLFTQKAIAETNKTTQENNKLLKKIFKILEKMHKGE